MLERLVMRSRVMACPLVFLGVGLTLQRSAVKEEAADTGKVVTAPHKDN